jgi:hypothetical protein
MCITYSIRTFHPSLGKEKKIASGCLKAISLCLRAKSFAFERLRIGPLFD